MVLMCYTFRMIISYYGKQFFKIQQGETIFAINPLSKDNTLGIKSTKFSSDVVLCSVRHKNYNGFDMVSYSDKKPFQIYGPGSYEVNGNLFVGFYSPALIDEESYINTIYFFSLDGISFCFLGDIADENIDQKTKEYIESVDIIFVPIGGKGTLDPVLAARVIKYFSPKIVIPMDYGNDRDPKSLETFQKEMSSDVKTESKYVFKKKDIEALNSHVVVLSE